jgi:hypothetical protein
MYGDVVLGMKPESKEDMILSKKLWKKLKKLKVLKMTTTWM